jgi:hydrogenase 3 maturation protease
VAILGIGNELMGDDAAGVYITETLKVKLAGQPDVLVINGSNAPENFVGKISSFNPDFVLLVDAAKLPDTQPGHIAWLDPLDTTGYSASTHTLPPHILCGFLVNEHNCALGLLGIQIEKLHGELGMEMSPPVQQSSDEIIRELIDLLG